MPSFSIPTHVSEDASSLEKTSRDTYVSKPA